MSWASVAQALVLEGGKALIEWLRGSKSETTGTAPSDATTERQETAAGAAANYSGKITERNAHASLEQKLDSKLRDNGTSERGRGATRS
jgi:hypothetical protein